ncbi:MAG: DUF937 domain-containing protein [Oscillospiraceae bacterium]|nr:DUF937 domain-containing protein [Oscillospiraceae bacterium]
MNLLSVILKVMLADAAVSALSGKTGLSSSSLKKLLPLAIPLLLRYMTNNASTQSGALSLLGALTQHSVARSADEMFAEADEVDGGKIVNHILGDDSTRAIQTLAAESGMSTDDVTRALGGLAPALLSILSAATTSASNQSASSGMDLTDLLTLFGGASAPASQQSVGTSLLGSLLGGTPTQQQQTSSMSLLDALLGTGAVQQQPVQQQTSLLGSLLGLGSTQQPVQQQTSSNGLGLLGSLLGVTPTQQTTQVKPASKPANKPSQAKPAQQQTSLLGSLLGAAPTQQLTQQTAQQNINNLNGNTLLSLLLGAMQ